MLFSPRMSLKQLAAFSQRASMCLLAGIDERTICDREVKNARGFAARRHLTTVSQMVNQGGTLSEGLAATGDFFPPLFREMVQVGEQSGHLGEVLKQLANHYENQITLRRNFLASITWPAIELFLAIAIVGFLIWIMGIINGPNHKQPIDPLGLGLIGNDGLVKYAAFVIIVGIALALVIRAVVRGVLWTRPLQRFMLRIPKIGPALQTVALARLGLGDVADDEHEHGIAAIAETEPSEHAQRAVHRSHRADRRRNCRGQFALRGVPQGRRLSG